MKQSYSSLVDVWSNPALVVDRGTRAVLECNSACKDVFGTPQDWCEIGGESWSLWWKKPTKNKGFELTTSKPSIIVESDHVMMKKYVEEGAGKESFGCKL